MIQAAPTIKLTRKDKAQLVLEMASLTVAQRERFMRRFGLPPSLSKNADVTDRIQTSLKADDFGYDEVLSYLDEVVPWGKQHVFLFKGPSASIKKTWKDVKWIKNHLKNNSPEFAELVGAPIQVGLPDAMTPVAVDVSSKRIHLKFVQRRELIQRDSTYNKPNGKTPAGEVVEYRAYVHRVVRNHVVFEWNTVNNTAMLRITQLPGRMRYANVRKEFNQLVAPILTMSQFKTLDLRKAVFSLNELEKTGNGITRAHGVDIHLLSGRTISAKSDDSAMSVFGVASLDNAYDSMAQSGTTDHGNLYWLPMPGNPLSDDLRVELVGKKDRVNFTSPSNEAIVRHVLSDIRKHC